MRLIVSAAALAGLMAGPAVSADLQVEVEIPTLKVAEYHRPYMALWIETPDQTAVKTLAVWYDVKKAGGEGKTWLKDLRQWWRRAGREMASPDAVSGATRAPGKQQVAFKAPLGTLAPGQYALVVEAVREVGSREAVRVPFQWPPKAAVVAKAGGTTELGAVTLTIKP
jgi:hypothetical protein